MQDHASSSDKRIAVAVDAMGGDLAPQAVVAGAIHAARCLSGVDVMLVGDEAVIRPQLVAAATCPENIHVRHATQVIDMCEAPGAAIRQKRDSSIAVGMRLLREGQVQAFVSAGSSGAMMAGAMLILKAQAGIDRPAIAIQFPTRRGRSILLDAGATADCKPVHLVQFARLGSAYASDVLGRTAPRVGLISIGEESSKGDELTKETHQMLLTTADINFVGNVEPKEFLRGEVDVAVCDGFVGNLILKAGEAFGELLLGLLKEEFGRSLLTGIAARILKPSFRRVKRLVDYAEYGGALLLGVNGVVVISHGRSNAQAIENAIRVGAEAAGRRSSCSSSRCNEACELFDSVSP